ASVANEAAQGAAAALTGPIVRGDVATIRRHLAALDPAARRLYRELATATLELAKRGGLERVKAGEIKALLTRPEGRARLSRP
ncbi:MAG TPA: DUF2520 domain-containing protein, partial [Gemmatimonadales bacterium]